MTHKTPISNKWSKSSNGMTRKERGLGLISLEKASGCNFQPHNKNLISIQISNEVKLKTFI